MLVDFRFRKLIYMRMVGYQFEKSWAQFKAKYDKQNAWMSRMYNFERSGQRLILREIFLGHEKQPG
jgi:hypothetical protein